MSQTKKDSIDISTPEKIKDVLHTALGEIGSFEQCALLDYPNHPNIGDHLIWLGEILYLTDVLKTKINYVTSLEDFSPEVMDKQVGKAPIILHGGGNLGDLWPKYQIWREQIISTYKDRQIIILPQSIYFKNQDNLARAAEVFNAHPNLTIFARESYSYELALKHFHNCRVIQSPDSAFQMVDMPLPSFKFNPRRPILYLCRDDDELNQAFAPATLGIRNLVVQDWINSQKWIYRGRGKFGEFKEWYWRIPGIVLLVREGWQRQGFVNPQKWMYRHKWETAHPYVDKFNTVHSPFIHQFSWTLMYTGIEQFIESSLVITNRLHAHILCVLLGIPNIFLPNSYYKNESFYKTWTYQIPYCKFIKEPSQVKNAAQELLSSFSQISK